MAILLFVCASFFLTNNVEASDNDVGFAKIEKPDKAITGVNMLVIDQTKSEAEILFVKNYTFNDVNYFVATPTTGTIKPVVKVVAKTRKSKAVKYRTTIRYLWC